MKKILAIRLTTRCAIATLMLATGSILPVQAVSFPSRNTSINNTGTIESEGILRADRLDEEFDDYRRSRHVQLERQLRQELSQQKYRYMSQQEKERAMRQAHDNLDDQLDRQEKAWRREYENRQDRYDNRYDEGYNNRYDRYDRFDSRYDDPQNPYGLQQLRYRDNRSRYNERYNDRWQR